jgi:hypothetical protein
MGHNLPSVVRRRLDSPRRAVKQHLRRWTRPDSRSLAVNAVLDLTRSKSELVLENAVLRQQLIVLQRQVKRPRLTRRDRVLCPRSQQTTKLENGTLDRPIRYAAVLASRSLPTGLEPQVKAQTKERPRTSG